MALELSYVNSSLQLLKEELQELNSSVDVDPPERCICVRGCACLRSRPGRPVCVRVYEGVAGVRGAVCCRGQSSREGSPLPQGGRLQPESPG